MVAVVAEDIVCCPAVHIFQHSYIPLAVPVVDVASHSIVIKFLQETGIWHFVKGLGEIKKDDINLEPLSQLLGYLVDGECQLGLTRPFPSEAMLSICQMLLRTMCSSILQVMAVPETD